MIQQKVSFNNRLGIELVADLYVPKNLDRSKKPAIVVGHPYGGVKEQSSGLYAQTMAERGYVTLAFDASYNGESGGQPHFIASPEALVEDFSAAVDFLGHELFCRPGAHRRHRSLRQWRLRARRWGNRPAHQGDRHSQHV